MRPHSPSHQSLRDLQGFVRPGARTILVDATSPAELLNKLEAYQAGQSLPELLASETRAKEGTS